MLKRVCNIYVFGDARLKSKGYRFYCPSHSTRIVESRNAKFLKNDLISGSDRFQDVVCERDHIDAQPSTLSDRLIVIHNVPQVQTNEMNSMASKGIWNLVELPNGAKSIGCKWVFKTKKDSLGNIERYKPLESCKKVMRYHQGTKDYMLMYRCTDNLEVISYSDSDYVGYIDSRTSTSGYVFMLTSGDVSWRSAK
ncbi:hypothetical protein CK203_116857 [Vitis vinifera]|uniref:Retrovirus-related Pol polyprotein from transposon TNT 1-94 n=1 Tax=Vitis vinifera TaxID=29760 RepID=A0A438FFI2_VITVI|nr:hypothetical protein CK203_116857 [Vitis vinifera]